MVTSQAHARPAPSSAPDKGDRGRTRRKSALLNAEAEGGRNDTADSGAISSVTRAGEKKRKAGEYDEDIEGFQFTRTNVKKAKSSTIRDAISEILIAEEPATQMQVPKRGRSPKTKPSRDSGPTTGEATGAAMAKKALRGRPKKASMRQVSEEGTNGYSAQRCTDTDISPIEKPRKKGKSRKAKTVDENKLLSPEPPPAGTSKIALPFADTPIIRRNKEMREGRAAKGQRRSSLGMRGRRASSLIESGVSNALPHKEVNTADFYKHIASEGLSEPRRMKQLLTWCATRAIGDTPSGSRSDDESARLAARVIQEEILRDFANKSELSDWFTREEADPSVITKKPNPKNIQNAEKIKELEEQIHRLQNERQALMTLLRPPSIIRTGPSHSPELRKQQSDQIHTQPSYKYALDDTRSPQNELVDVSLLHPCQQSLLITLDPSSANIQRHKSSNRESPTQPSPDIPPPISPAAVSSRLSRITSSLAPTLDSFSLGLHDIELYRAAADNISSKVLCICSQRLEERDVCNAQRILEIENFPNDSGGGVANEGKAKVRIRPERLKEDIGLVLGALSRVERR